MEELGINREIKNDKGLAALDSIRNESSFPEVVAYLSRGDAGHPAAGALRQSPGVPPNINIKIIVSIITEQAGDESDPEFRRRIDELASRDTFHTSEGQVKLRSLVQEALMRLGAPTAEARELERRNE